MALKYSSAQLKLLRDGAPIHGLPKFKFDIESIRPSHIDSIVSKIYEELEILDASSGGGIPEAEVFLHEVVLTKSDVNNLHTTPVLVSNSDLALAAGQGAVIFQASTEVVTDDDGTPFVGSGNRITVTNGALDVVKQFFDGQYNSTGYRALPSSVIENITADTGWSIDATGAITGGGTNSTITLKIYYRKVTV